MTRPIVAIDGPAGAGKSTVARELARRLGFVLLDTGAIYRSVALAAKQAGTDWDDEPAVAALADALAQNARLRLEALAAEDDPTGKGLRVWLDGEDVSLAIRAPDISMGASRVSAIEGVRAALLEMQRSIGRAGGVVAEGRDIGTVVFPDAGAKFYLTASTEVRAARRQRELAAKGVDKTLEETIAEVEQRDRQDSEREIAPLRQADDAVRIDSTGRGIPEVLDEMERIVAERTGDGG